MNKKTNFTKANFVFEELEPRLLLSADGLGVITDSSVATVQALVHGENQNIIIVQNQTEQSSTVIHNKVQTDSRSELVIIDSRAPNFQQLHNDIIKAQQQGRDINVVLLDAHRDGIEQISEALSKYNKLDAVHIVSHGKDAQLQLGATQLNNQNLKQYNQEIEKWKQVFTDGGDMLIYGCNLAGTSNGTGLVNSLSGLTGTDVAASDDVTGSNVLGGDWDLEYQTGDIETNIAFTADLQENWQGALNADALVAEQVAAEEEQQTEETQVQEQEAALIAEAEAVLLAEEKEAEIIAQEPEQQAGIVEEQRLEIVFIDESVTDYQSFIEDLNKNNDGSINFEIVLLDNDSNGIEQISETLSFFDEVDAIHILSHGNDGSVKLGDTWLSDNNIDEYRDSINIWGSSLDENADILIYGCNLADSESGENFVNQLALLTDADVATSDDVTGSALLGGDWDLEYQVGHVETQSAVSVELQQSYESILATETVIDNFSTGDYTGNTGSQSWTGDWIEVDAGGVGAVSGNVVVTGGEVSISVLGSSIAREVDLSNATSAMFSFDFHTGIGIEAADPDSLVVEVSDDGGATWTTLEDINYLTGVNSGSKSYDISAYMAVDTQIRFRANAGYGGPDEFFYADNVQIEYTTNVTPSNNVPGTQTTNEDTSLLFNAANSNLISISDADAGTTPLEVTLTVNDGILTLSGTTGLIFNTGSNGSATMTFSGTLLDINTALDGLTFTPDANFNGSASLQITSHDDTTLLSSYSFDDVGNLGTDGGPGIAYDGTVTGATLVNDAIRGDVLSLDGSTHVEITGFFDEPVNVTLAAWVNLTAYDLNGTDIFSLGDNLILRYESWNDSLNGIYYDGTNWNNITFLTTINLDGDGWHHVAYSVDDTNNIHTIYFDGVAVASATMTDSIVYTNGTNSYIGAHGELSPEWDLIGLIDDARVYDRALSAAEIAGIMNSAPGNDSDTINITVNAINDAPVNTVPIGQSTPQDTDLVFNTTNSNLISISDLDAGASTVEITLAATNGTLTLNGGGGLVTVGNEITTNTDVTYVQTNVKVAMDASGGYVSVWQSTGQDGDLEGIFAQRYDANGAALGSVWQVNTETAGDQSEPEIAMDAAGNFVITWQSYGQDKNGTWGIYAQRYNAVGTAQGGEFLVNTSTTNGTQQYPNIAMDSAGNFVIVWDGAGSGDGNGVLGQRFDAAGNFVGGEFMINTETVDTQWRSSVDMAATGEFVVTWGSNLQDGDAWGIYAQRFNNMGVAQGSEFLVNVTTATAQWDPLVAVKDNGEFVVAWTVANDGDSRGINARVFDASGTAQTGEIAVNTTTAGMQYPHDIALTDDGGFIATWTTPVKDIFMQKFDWSGTAIGAETLVNTTVSSTQNESTIASNANGDYVILWQNDFAVPGNGIYAQHYVNPDLLFSIGDGADDSSMTLTGTLADINKVLDGLTFTPTPGYNGPATVTITTDDQGNTGTGGALIDDDTVNITVGTGNSTPTDISLSASSVNENVNTAGGHSVGTLTSTDADGGETFTYSILAGNDGANFSIGGAGSDELIIDDGVLNFENKSTYQVTVRTTDSASNTFDELLTITVNNLTGTVSGVAYTDEGVTNIGAGKTISMLINGVLAESVVTTAGGVYSFTQEANAGDAVALFIDNDATYKGITLTVSDGSDLSGIQVMSDHVVVRNDNGGVTSNTDLDNALGAFSDTDIHYTVVGGTLIANGVSDEVLVPVGHTYAPGGDVSASNIKVLGTLIGGSSTFTVAGDWNSSSGTWSANTSSVVLNGTGTLNSVGSSFYDLTTGAASQVTTLTSNLTVSNVLTIAHATGTLTDAGGGYDINVTGTGTPFVNNGSTVIANNFIYSNSNSVTITVAGGIYNVAESLWFDSQNSGAGTTFELDADLQVTGSGVIRAYSSATGLSILDTTISNHNITASNLQIGNSLFQAGFIYANNSTIDINGDVAFTNSANTTINLGSSNWSVSGNWTNNSNTFTAGTSTVTFDGLSQLISGSTIFYNFTKTESSNDTTDSTLTFDNTATQTVNGTLTLNGLDADDRINLVSDVPGNQWGLILSATATQAIDYVEVTDSNASASDASQLLITSVNSLDGGNNIGWFNDAPIDLKVTGTTDGGINLNADGGNDVYFVADNGGTLLGGLSTVTVEASFSITTPGADLSPLLSYADGANDEELALLLKWDGNMWFGASSNGTPLAQTTGSYTQLFDGEKHQVSVSWDSSTGAVDFYIDGLFVESVAAYQTGLSITGGGQLVFGQDQDSELGGFLTSDVFSGTLYDVRIFDDVRTAGEVAAGYDQTLPSTEAGMIANWVFNNLSTGGVVTDTVSGHNLTEQHVSGFTPSTSSLTLSIQEGAANGAIIGSVVAIDPDVGDTFTYTLLDDAGGRFAINSSTGQITLADTSLVDYEAATSHNITIRVTDSDLLTYDEVFTVDVINVNDAPILDNTGITSLSDVKENEIDNSGDLVSDIIASAGGDRITDADAGAVEGIAVTVVDNTNGTWEYSIDGGTNWTAFGSVTNTSAVVLTATGSDRIRFVPNASFSGVVNFSFHAWDTTDGLVSGTTSVDVSSNGGSTTFSSASEDVRVEVLPVEIRILFTTDSDINNSGVPGIKSWTTGDVLAIGDPNLSFEPLGSDGSVYSYFNLDMFASDGDMQMQGLHFVSRDVTVGSANSVDLQRGDILFVSSNGETMTSTNSLTFAGGDVIAFRPDTPDDYSSGTFIHVLDQPGIQQTTGITLVEANTLVGDVILQGGSFLFTQADTGSGEANNIYHYSADDAGAGTTTGTVSTFITGTDIDVEFNEFIGVMLVTQDTPLNGTTVTAGTIITTLANGDSFTGDNSIATNEDEVLTLTVSSTTMGITGTTAADVAVLFDGGDIGLNNNNKKMRSLAFIEIVGPVNVEPVITLPSSGINYTENDPPAVIDATATLVDPDSADFDGGILRVEIASNGTANDRLSVQNEGVAAGQVGVSGNNVTYGGTVIGNFLGGTSASDPLFVYFDANSDVTAVQAVMRNITYENTSTSPSTAQRTVNFVISDGDLGSSAVVSTTIDVVDVVTSNAPVATNDPGGYSAIVSSYNPPSYWSFDETSGTTASDNGSTANGGTFNGVTLGQTGAINGDTGTAIGFDGSNDYVVIPHDDAYLIDDGTVQLWFNANDLLTDQGLFSKDSTGFDTGGHLTIRTLTDGRVEVRLQSTTDSNFLSSGAGTVTAGSWYHVAVTFGASGMELFLDGVSVDTNPYTGGMGTTSGGIGNYEPIAIGAATWVSGNGIITPLDDFFGGSIDEVAIIDQALTAEQIQDIFASALQNYTILEDTSLVVSAAEGVLINDSDADGDPLTAVLDVGPSNAASFTLNADGSFSYTPLANFNGTDTFTYRANDGSANSNVATVTITVNGDNDAPVNTVPATQTVLEDTQTAIAGLSVADPDAGASLIATQLTVTNGVLDVTLAGATTISAGTNGSSTLTISGNVTDINATLASLQYTGNPNVNGVAADTLTVVTDDLGNTGTGGALTDTDIVQIDITAVNDAPVLGAIGNQSINELATLSFTATATDSDIPVDTLTFSLDATSLALGMTINASTGAFSWTPTEGQGGSAPSVTVTVTDNGMGNLVDSETFTITVNDVNVAPVLGAIGNQSIDELATLSFTATATDSDLPADTLTYSLDAASMALGMTINASTGAFSWTPTEGQGGSSPSVTVTVTDNGTGNLVDSETFTITVNDVNVAPVLGAIGNQSINELATLSFTATATDSDLPADTLTFSLDATSLAAGMTINASTGVFSWTPTEGQGGLTPSVTVTVTDSGTGNLVDSETFTVSVGNTNTAPVLGAIGNQSINELSTLSFTATATDSDVPVDTLTYSLDAASMALGMTINASTGAFSWTPTEGQGGSAPSVTVTVTDNGTGNLVDSETFTITVNDVNTAPVLGAIGNQSINELATLSFTATATDSDLPADTLTFSLDATSLAAGMTINASTGAFSWTPTEGQGGSAPSVTVTVTDNGTGNLVDSETFTITVNDVNVAPVLGAIGNQSINELVTLSFTATATDSDDPVDTLTFSLDAASSALGMTINASTGAFSWTPTEAQGGISPSVTVTVTDGGTGNLVDSETFTITVADINIAPTVANLVPDQNATEDSLFTFQFAVNTFDDFDGDTLTYTSDASGWLSFDAATRTFSGTPLNADVGTTTVTITANDGSGGIISDTFDIVISNTNDPAIIGGVDTGSVTEDLDPDFDTLLEVSGVLTVSEVDTGEDGFTAGTITGLYGDITIDTIGNWTYQADNSQVPVQSLASGGTIIDTISITSFDGTAHNIVITIGGVNDAPVANDDTAPSVQVPTVDEGGTAIFDLAFNDMDIEGNATIDLSSIAIVGAPLNGALVVNGDGTVTYTHDGSETINDSFAYTIEDINGAVSNIATVNIVVNPLNDGPVAVDDILPSVNEGGVANINLALNDTDADGNGTIDLNSIAIVVAPSNGILVVNGDGTVTYTHDGSNTVSDSFTYTIADITGSISNVASVNIIVNPVNDTPTTIGITDVTVSEDSSSTTIDLNAAFDDADNLDSELSYTIVGNSSIGLFTSAAVDATTAELVLDYAADMNGTSNISVRAMDPSGAFIDTLFSVTVTPQNDSPELTTNNSLLAFGTNSINITQSELNVDDIDNSNNQIVYTIDVPPSYGVLLLNGVVTNSFAEDDILNNRVSYQSYGTSASDQFSFSVSDGSGGSIVGNNFNIVVQLAPVEPEEPVDPEEPTDPETPVDPELPVTPEEHLPPVDDEFNLIGANSTPELQQPILSLDPVDDKRIEADVVGEKYEFSAVDFSSARTYADIQVKSINALWVAIDQMKQEMNESISEDVSMMEFRSAAVSSSGVALTAGVVAWVLRSGALMTSLMSTIPLWKGYDPLPLLAYKDDDEEKDKVSEDNIPTSLEELRKIKALKEKFAEKVEQQMKIDALFEQSNPEEPRQ